MNDFGKIISLAKVFAMALGDRTITISSEERDAAFEGLKTMTDHRDDWTEEQKEYYKMMVDFGNEATK
jgi:lipid II:glycine glycyltransferase (peptidoglycan interpeptide bridge formation enzyme)